MTAIRVCGLCGKEARTPEERLEMSGHWSNGHESVDLCHPSWRPGQDCYTLWTRDGRRPEVPVLPGATIRELYDEVTISRAVLAKVRRYVDDLWHVGSPGYITARDAQRDLEAILREAE